MALKPKCIICGKACRKNQVCLPCVICDNHTHRKCSGLSTSDLHKHVSMKVPFYCKKCNDDIFPYSSEDNSSPDLEPTPNNTIFECGVALDPSHLNSLFVNTTVDNIDELDKNTRNLIIGFQPIADKYYNADKIPFDDFEITAQNQFSDQFSSIGINMRSLANSKNFAKLQVFIDSLYASNPAL